MLLSRHVGRGLLIGGGRVRLGWRSQRTVLLLGWRRIVNFGLEKHIHFAQSIGERLFFIPWLTSPEIVTRWDWGGSRACPELVIILGYLWRVYGSGREVRRINTLF
jgi:hypothetical protein